MSVLDNPPIVRVRQYVDGLSETVEHDPVSLFAATDQYEIGIGINPWEEAELRCDPEAIHAGTACLCLV